MIKVGITGGIGSGKTVISKIADALGYPIYNSDFIAKQLVYNHDVRSSIIQLLGTQAYDEAGVYNRSYIGSKVFSDIKLLQGLNDIIHPAVKLDFKKWCNNQSSKLVFQESALLLDHGFNHSLDYVIAVVASNDTRLNRIKDRDSHRSIEQINAILEKQGDWNKKSQEANFIIRNDEGDFLTEQLEAVIQKLL